MANLYNDNAPAGTLGSAYNTLTAFFDSRADADRAVARLKDAGVADESIRFMPGYEADPEAAARAGERSGFWAALEDWFFPDDDRETYAEGLRRGGFLISVSVDDALYDTAHDILDDEGSIDMDERADMWRSDGWEARNSSFAGSANSGRAAEDFSTSEQAVPEESPVGSRDPDHSSPRVRAYHFDQMAPGYRRDH